MSGSDPTPPPQDLDVTVASPSTAGAAPPLGGEHGRFLPGARFGNRYRIVGLLGRGGMGEVYRADDLELGQSVALKLLPASLSNDAAALGRLRSEVRLARQVSHPNVCRVYDLGEAEGQHFLTMEFVDGEDLAALLSRIGRLPQEKGLDLAHQLCSGLDAAHSAGILHRDLKPANIMIDGRGRARLMDFGLALADDDAAREPAAGTFAYMAPEQLSGRSASTATDIYALGLVLYELLSGKRAHQAESLQDLREQRTGGATSSLRTIVDLLDPVVEQTIMRCLDPDPARRPSSARAIAAALPGGDPLAAAMAAGETPSPEVVAAAGDNGGLKPLYAMIWLLIALSAIPGTLVLQARYGLLGYLPAVMPPEELREEAIDMMRRLGHDEPVDTSGWYSLRSSYLNRLSELDEGEERWSPLRSGRPSALNFDYRQSPRLLSTDPLSFRVTEDEPPRTIPGMVNAKLDCAGRLLSLLAVPARMDSLAPATRAPDWQALFREAGLDSADFVRVPPERFPFDYADSRAAWLGHYPGAPEDTLRVEAAAFRGLPVYFDVIDGWEQPPVFRPESRSIGGFLGQVLGTAILLGLFGWIGWLARRNMRSGRSDRKGALRVGLVVAALVLLKWIVGASHVPKPLHFTIMFAFWVGIAVFSGGLIWLVYVAFEPFARRHWPNSLVAWNRLLAGRLRDPLVGRTILIGFAVGTLIELLEMVQQASYSWLELPPAQPGLPTLGALMGGRFYLGEILDLGLGAVLGSLFLFSFVLILRVLLRRNWITIAAFVLLLLALSMTDGEHILPNMIAGLFAAVMLLFLILRFGFLALSASFFAGLVGGLVPFPTDVSDWTFGRALLPVLVALLLLAYVFTTAIGLWGGRPRGTRGQAL